MTPEKKEVINLTASEIFHSAHVRRAHGKQDKWEANCRNCLASRNILKLPFFLGLITADMQQDECAYMLHACIS